jgi:hypothetical protein
MEPAIIRPAKGEALANKSPSKRQILGAWTLTSINQVGLNIAQCRRGGRVIPPPGRGSLFNCNSSTIDHSFQQQLIQA